MTPKTETIPVAVTIFEDIIDGYFPLQESLRQMLCRNRFASACVTLTHVPIMDIPGLAPDAPVPLRLTKGMAGIAERLDIIVTLDGVDPTLSGIGKWRWFSDDKAQAKLLSPLTRLAEPAIVHGVGLIAGGKQTQTFGQVAIQPESDFVILQGQRPDLQHSPDAVVWAAPSIPNEIHNGEDPNRCGYFKTSAAELERNLEPVHGSEFTEILMLKDAANLAGA